MQHRSVIDLAHRTPHMHDYSYIPLTQTILHSMLLPPSLLLQVIYALNTQNEEHEEFVSKLRSLHEAEVQRLLTDSTARLERCEEGFTKERETQIKRIDELKASVEKVEGERDQLHNVQVGTYIAPLPMAKPPIQ